MNKKPTRVVRLLNIGFRSLGPIVADYPTTVIITMLVLSAVCSIKLILSPTEDDFREGYTPLDAPAKKEQQVFREFNNGDLIASILMVTAKDGKSMTRLQHLNETIRLMETIGSYTAVRNSTFYDLCTSHCDDNMAVLQFRNGLLIQGSDLRRGRPVEHENIRLTFPLMGFFGHDLDMTLNFYGVKTLPCGELDNRTITNVKEAHLIVLNFRAIRPKSWTTEDVKSFERQLSNLGIQFDSPLLNVAALSFTTSQDEMVRTPKTLLPYFIIGFIIMVVFATVSVAAYAIPHGQFSIFKIVYAIMACISPLLATGCGIGCLLWCGMRFGSLLLITPFLVIIVGVDDGFLMIHAWQKISISRIMCPKQKDTIRDRVTEMLVEVGSSATITSLTNMLAFGIGIFSPLPEIQLFSAANAITMLFDFIYQITFFAAIFSIGGRYELENELKQIEKSLRKTEIALSNHAEKANNVKINPKKKSNNDNDKSDNGVLTKVRTLFARMVRDQNDDINEKKTNEKEKKVVIISGVGREIGDNTDSGTSTVSIGSDANSERIAKVMRNALILGYCQWISNRFTLMLNIILLILYWTFCILNAVKAKAGLTPQKLFLSDSQTIKALGIRDNYVFNVHSPVWIYVNNVGNLSDPQIRQRHYEMIESFELLPECNGKPFTKFWLRAYEDYLAASDSAPDEESVNEDLESTISQSYTTDRIIQFMEWPETKFWGSFIRLTDDRKRIRAYSAMVVFHGEKLYLWPEKYKLLLKWRQIANNFSDLSASVFDENSQYMDQIDSLIPLVINNSVLTLFSMAFVCFLFMNDTRMVVFASVTVTSIFIGVFGILTFLGIDVDPLSMSVMILTIGLSVDYPAHIVYHFCRFRDRGECKNVAEVMERTFISVGYPVLQCSFSALLFVTCVFFVDSYMSMILWRVMSLVVLLGLYHTLFVIPCFLCAKQIQVSP